MLGVGGMQATDGYHWLSRNLNAELGFARVRFEIVACFPLKLALSGVHCPVEAFQARPGFGPFSLPSSHAWESW